MINGELIVDNFAGGGGASTGIEEATGYCDGKPYPRAEQVRRCGNAVCPPIPTALVRANLKELCVAKRLPNCRADRLGEDAGGQLRFA